MVTKTHITPAYLPTYVTVVTVVTVETVVTIVKIIIIKNNTTKML